MFLRTRPVTLVLTLASGVLVAGHTAEAQRVRDNRAQQTARGDRYDDWTVEGFRDLDVDRNGRISAAEWSFDREDFRRADHNGDGVITQREFLGEDDTADDARADADRPDADRRGRRSDDDDRPAADRRGRRSDDDTRFADLDANRDNRVSRGEWRDGRASFDRLDENRDGYLTRAELATVDAESDGFASLDVDRNGVITRGEWPEAAANFRRLDTNGDGRVTSTEYAGGRADATPAAAAAATQSAAYRAGHERGVIDGRAAGREDRERNQGFDLDGQRELEQADAGFDGRIGSRADYQAGYRAGFRIAYNEGYGRR
jgi:Ca2+-binding EF-hand superfamily protein